MPGHPPPKTICYSVKGRLNKMANQTSKPKNVGIDKEQKPKKSYTLLGGNDNAVSAVIGVILMVAVTVILAAIIGAFVLGISGNLPKTPGYAAFDATRTSDGGIKITNIGANGQPIEVIKLITGSTAYVHVASPTPTNTPVDPGSELELTVDDRSALNTLGVPVYIAAGSDNLPSSKFVLTIIGRTTDGGENILQNIDVPAAP